MLSPQQRRDRQARQLEEILSLPQAQQAGALFAVWPQRLPKVVRNSVSLGVKKQWRRIRSLAHSRRKALEQEKLRLASKLEVQHRMLLSQVGYRADMMLAYGQTAEDILTLGTRVKNEKILSVGLVNDPDGEYNFHFPANFEHGSPGDVETEILLRMLCVALASEGVFLIHQKLPMRTQVPVGGGKFEWRTPERLHALYCAAGTWSAMTPQSLRQVYDAVEDEEGYLAGGVLTFGQIEELAGPWKTGN